VWFVLGGCTHTILCCRCADWYRPHVSYYRSHTRIPTRIFF